MTSGARTADTEVLGGGPSPRSDRRFRAASVVLFAGTAAATVAWCGSMSGGMAMPGGWTMSMAWMRMPGQSWPGAAASYLAMWTLMMVAMMLPSLVPMLSRFRRSIRGPSAAHLGRLSVAAGAAYFLVWATFGAAVYPAGVLIGAAAMHWPAFARAVPAATALVLLLAGLVQFTAWKERRLSTCRDERCGGAPGEDVPGALRHGLGLGVSCCVCCLNLTVVLLVTGAMNLTVMGAVAAAISAERLAPWPRAASRAVGLGCLVVAAWAGARALGAA